MCYLLSLIMLYYIMSLWGIVSHLSGECFTQYPLIKIKRRKCRDFSNTSRKKSISSDPLDAFVKLDSFKFLWNLFEIWNCIKKCRFYNIRSGFSSKSAFKSIRSIFIWKITSKRQSLEVVVQNNWMVGN